MTFRARPTTKPASRARRGTSEEHRRNLYLNIGFGLIVLLSVLLLVGAAGATWYNQHLATMATVNGVGITKDQIAERAKVEAFKLDQAALRIQQKSQAGQISSASAQQILQLISQQQQQLSTSVIEYAIDTELVRQLAAKRGLTIDPADVDAQMTKDATVPESRHAWMIAIAPEKSTGATSSTDAQIAAAKASAGKLLADLQGGKTWEDVVKESGDAAAQAGNGDLLYVDKGTTSPDTAFVDALMALPDTKSYTGVIQGADGSFRIGRVTDIVAATVDTSFEQRLRTAGVDVASYRAVAASFVARDKIQAQLFAEILDKASPQRQADMIVLQAAGTSYLPGSILVKHILYSPNHAPSSASTVKADDPAWAAAKQQADDAYRKLNAGLATFADLAATSDDTGSGAQNGFLGYLAKDDPNAALDPAFAAAVFAPGVKAGQLLPPVKSAFGWHVIQVVSLDTPDAYAKSIAAQAAQPGADFAQLAQLNSIDSSAKNGGLLGWVAKYQVAKDEEDAIFALQKGGVSGVIAASDGNRIYKVVDLQDRLPDPSQADTIRSSAFSNWYASVKNDPTQTTITRAGG